MSPKLIGITGKAGCGKDTVANMLRQRGYETYAFAKPLKAALAAIGFPEPESRLDKEAKYPEKDYSYRRLMQVFGTDFVRKVLGEQFWVELAEKNVDLAVPTVITDVRFENEADFIRKNGGVVWHVIRESTLTGVAAQHPSEKGVVFIPLQDIAIDNRGSLIDLESVVMAALDTSAKLVK